MRDGTELEGLADAPDTATDTVGQDLHLSLPLSDLLSLSSAEASRPSHPPADANIIDPNFLQREEPRNDATKYLQKKNVREIVSFIFSSEIATLL